MIRKAIVGRMNMLRMDRSLHPWAAARDPASSLVIAIVTERSCGHAHSVVARLPPPGSRPALWSGAVGYGGGTAPGKGVAEPCRLPARMPAGGARRTPGPAGWSLRIAVVFGEGRGPIIRQALQRFLGGSLVADHIG